MGRVAKNIEKDKLEAIIVDLESKNTYPNRSSLFTEVASQYDILHGVSFSHSCAGSYADKFSIITKTQKGERGGGAGAEALKKFRETGEVTVKPVRGDVKPMLAYFAKDNDGKNLKLAKRAAKGNFKAMVKLNCIFCADNQPKEVKLCPCKECVFWAHRPYQ